MLQAERNGGFLTGILGLPGTPWAAKRHSREAYWESSLSAARQLVAQIVGENLPVIVVGDLNNPPFGPFYRVFSSNLSDTHRDQGQGYGFTFPGETGNPLALFRPWLRIDYIWHSPTHWTTTRQVTEPSRASQHRAVFAELAIPPTR
jgi:endonuclease/exonuclease/phosphatase (EEP) superfamily protein YafD